MRRSPAEVLMFAFAAIIAVVGGLAAYAYFSPKLQRIPNRIAEGFKADRVNILLIGVGGDTHPGEGKELADSVMLVSLQPSTRRVALISLPRDLYVKIPGHGMHRINAAHAIDGPAGMMNIVERVSGVPVHAYARVDFRAFREVIDELGGIDIYVYRPFHDELFNDGFRAGWQHMDGSRALRFARYRYVRASAEGNVFGRELRQQQVLEAIRDKVARLPSRDVLKLINVARSVGDHTETNLTATQIAEFYATFRNTPRRDIRNVSLKQFMEVIAVNTPGDTGDAVRPIGNDYAPIRRVVARVFEERTPIVAADEIPMTDVAGANVASSKAGTLQHNAPQSYR